MDEDYQLDIISIIQNHVIDISKSLYSNDICFPIFMVSVLHYDKDKQSIILTISHNDRNFSRMLFPQKDCFYGYDSLCKIMKDLYNQTM